LVEILHELIVEKLGDEDYDRHGQHLDVINFFKQHIQTLGMNEIGVAWDKDTINNKGDVWLEQTASNPAFPTLRYHKVQIAFYNEKGEIFNVIGQVIPNKFRKKVIFEEDDSKISTQVAAILPNYHEYAYARIKLDDVSAKWFAENLTSKPIRANDKQM